MSPSLRFVGVTALVVCAVVCVAIVGTSEGPATSDVTSLVSASERHKMHAASRVAIKSETNKKISKHTAIEQEAYKEAEAALSGAIGSFARKNPKMPGQEAMRHVVHNQKTLYWVTEKTEKALKGSSLITSANTKSMGAQIPHLALQATQKAVSYLEDELDLQDNYQKLSATEKAHLHEVLTNRASETSAGFLGEAIQHTAQLHPKAPGRSAMLTVVNSHDDQYFIEDEVEQDLKTTRSVKAELPEKLVPFIPLVARGVARTSTHAALEQMKEALRIKVATKAAP